MNLASFDLNLIRVLDALLREGSTVRAGERLGLSQPAVSAALNRLRHALKDPLFVRHGQGLVPTAFARSLELPIAEVLDRLSSLLSGPDAFDPSQSVDRFKLTGTDLFAEDLLPRLAAALSREAPRIRVQWADLVYDQYLPALRDRDIDFALLPQSDFPDWTEHQTLMPSSFDVVARSDHPALRHAGIEHGMPIPLDLFCELPQVAFAFNPRWKWGIDAVLDRLGRKRRVVMEVHFFNCVWRVAAESGLIAVLPRHLAKRVAPQAGLSIHPLPFETPHALLCILWHRRLSDNPAHRWLRNRMADLLTPNLQAGSAPR